MKTHEILFESQYEDEQYLDGYVQEIIGVLQTEHAFNPDMIDKLQSSTSFRTAAEEEMNSGTDPSKMAWQIWELSQEHPDQF